MQPWKTDKWYVSPWCYLPEARKNDHFAAKIKIHVINGAKAHKIPSEPAHRKYDVILHASST